MISTIFFVVDSIYPSFFVSSANDSARSFCIMVAVDRTLAAV